MPPAARSHFRRETFEVWALPLWRGRWLECTTSLLCFRYEKAECRFACCPANDTSGRIVIFRKALMSQKPKLQPVQRIGGSAFRKEALCGSDRTLHILRP